MVVVGVVDAVVVVLVVIVMNAVVVVEVVVVVVVVVVIVIVVVQEVVYVVEVSAGQGTLHRYFFSRLHHSVCQRPFLLFFFTQFLFGLFAEQASASHQFL